MKFGYFLKHHPFAKLVASFLSSSLLPHPTRYSTKLKHQQGKMDEKLGYRYDKVGKPAHATMKPYSRPARRVRPLLALTLVALGFYYYMQSYMPFADVPDIAMLAPKYVAPVTEKPIVETSALVPFEAHIMSKCPDAKDCLRSMVLPAMQRVYDKVNFTLSYIGTPTANDGVDCKHGPEECMQFRLSGPSQSSRYVANI